MQTGYRGLVAVLLLGSFGCGVSNTGGTEQGAGGVGGEAADPRLEGFTRLTGLGEACMAAVSDAPATKYTPLAFIACLSGEADCQQPKWDGELTWDPVGDGDMLEYSLQASSDDAGTVTRLLITKQYPHSKASSGTPQEAVVYDLANGSPLAAFRRLLDAGSVTGGRSASGERSCDIVPVATQSNVVLLATPSSGSEVLWASTPYADAAMPPTLRPLGADASVMLSPAFGSLDVAGVGQDDGGVWRLDAVRGTALSARGDTQRLFLDAVAGDELLLRNVDSTTLYAFGQQIPAQLEIEATFLRGDALRFVWLVKATPGYEVWTAERDGMPPSKSARQVAVLPDADNIAAVTLGDATLAVQSGQGQSLVGDADALYLVNLRDGTVSARTRQGSAFLLLANTATHVWVGESDFLSVSAKPTQFERLLRLSL